MRAIAKGLESATAQNMPYEEARLLPAALRRWGSAGAAPMQLGKPHPTPPARLNLLRSMGIES